MISHLLTDAHSIDAYLLVIRLWTSIGSGFELTGQLAYFDGSPEGRAAVMHAYGYT
jgi:hypothetical protein